MEREGKKVDKNAYWQPIPSENLYLFADKIVNMNLNFKSPVGRIADHEAIRKLLIEVIGKSFITKDVTITQEKPESSAGSSQPQQKPPETDGQV